MPSPIQEVWVKPLELAKAFLTFWSEGGFQGVLGAAGSFRELPGRFPGPKCAGKDQIGAESTS